MTEGYRKLYEDICSMAGVYGKLPEYTEQIEERIISELEHLDRCGRSLENRILHEMYINQKSPEAAAKELKSSVSTVWYKRRTVLKRLSQPRVLARITEDCKEEAAVTDEDRVEYLDLPQRILYALRRGNIKTVGEVRKLVSCSSCKKVRGISIQSLQEIQEVLDNKRFI